MKTPTLSRGQRILLLKHKPPVEVTFLYFYDKGMYVLFDGDRTKSWVAVRKEGIDFNKVVTPDSTAEEYAEEVAAGQHDGYDS